MTENDAQRIADQFVSGKAGWSFKPIGIRTVDKRPDEWVVLYDATNSLGVSFDGPIVVLVNKLNGTARFQVS